MRSPAERVTAWGPSRRVIRRADGRRAGAVARDVYPYLAQRRQPIVDIGAGTGVVAAGLAARGLRVVPVDVRVLSVCDDVEPILYDGRRLPFPAGSFGAALLAFVLHHARDPHAVLEEAGRVAERLVVYEDLRGSMPRRVATRAVDALLNLEPPWRGSGTRTDAGWRALFARHGFTVVAARYTSLAPLFRQGLYVLERGSREAPAGSDEHRHDLAGRHVEEAPGRQP